MEDEARKRKERLAALKKRKFGGDAAATDQSANTSERNLTFRSYIPKDENLKEHVNIATPADVGETIESETQNLAKEVLAEAANRETDEVDLFNLQPKKPNWDLKRDVQKKLDKLDRKTQRAILELIRKRLAEEGDTTTNLAEAVANAEKQHQLEDDDDE
ncbi:mRNA splicing factor [Dichotomocladium elegans]|nr:mRNA splicing factor [Dichotomocladium elegans]